MICARGVDNFPVPKHNMGYVTQKLNALCTGKKQFSFQGWMDMWYIDSHCYLWFNSMMIQVLWDQVDLTGEWGFINLKSIESLDISGCTKLIKLDVSKCKKLVFFHCENNELKK